MCWFTASLYWAIHHVNRTFYHPQIHLLDDSAMWRHSLRDVTTDAVDVRMAKGNDAGQPTSQHPWPSRRNLSVKSGLRSVMYVLDRSVRGLHLRQVYAWLPWLQLSEYGGRKCVAGDSKNLLSYSWVWILKFSIITMYFIKGKKLKVKLCYSRLHFHVLN